MEHMHVHPHVGGRHHEALEDLAGCNAPGSVQAARHTHTHVAVTDHPFANQMGMGSQYIDPNCVDRHELFDGERQQVLLSVNRLSVSGFGWPDNGQHRQEAPKS